MEEKLKVEFVPREVVESKLLTALEDEETVAILASEEDLQMLLFALRSMYATLQSVVAFPWVKRRGEMIVGLEKLKQEAFDD